jgi:hypothetical protein
MRTPIRLLHDGARSRTTTSEGRSWDCTTSYFPASSKIDYFKQLKISTVENGITSAGGTGPASKYKVELYHLFVMFCLFLYIN